MPEAASSISARTMASRISGGACARDSGRKASGSSLSDIVGFSLDLGHAAIDVKLDSCDVTRFFRCKEGNRFGDLIRISQSAQGNSFCEIALHLCQRVALLPAVENRRIDVSGADRIHANMAGFLILGSSAHGQCGGRLRGGGGACRRRSLYLILRSRERY